MAILGIYNKASDFTGGVDDTATTAARDTTLQPSSIRFARGETGSISWEPSQTDLWVHFDFYADSTAWTGTASDGTWLGFVSENGSFQYFMGVGSNGTFRLEIRSINTSSVTAGGYVANPAGLVLHTIDMNIRINPGALGTNYFDFYLNGVLYTTVSTAVTAFNVSPIKTLMLMHTDPEANLHYSQVVVANEDTRGMKVATMYPDANGNYLGMGGTFSDVLNKTDFNHLVSDAVDERQSWTVTDYFGPASPSSIRGVYLSTWAKAGETGPQQIDPFVRIAGVDYDSGPVPAQSWGKQIITEFSINPATGLPWTTAELSSLEIGVRSST